ncbi:MAG: DUF6188 family protein [Reyranellaceae bacterium]
MHGLPKDIDVSFFIGQALTQLCFGGNDLLLNFDDNLSVSVTSRVELEALGTQSEIEDFKAEGAPLLVLIERTIEAATPHEDGTLELRFDGDMVLRLIDDSPHYESYVIWHGKETIAV